MAAMVTASHDASYVQLGSDLLVPRLVSIVETEDYEGGSLTIRIDAEFSETLSRYRVAKLVVEADGDELEVASTTLRAVRVQEILSAGLVQVAEFRLLSGETWPWPLREDLVSFVTKSGPSSLAAMEWVARIYMMAQALRVRPASAVRTQLGLTLPTASVWIRRARDRGFLPDATLEEAAPRG